MNAHRVGAAGLALVCAVAAFAQFTLRSNISGLVTDRSGGVIPGVTVVLTDVDHNQIYTATTNAAGLYLFTNLAASRYQLKVERAGFRKTESPEITLGTAENKRIDLPLEVGQVTESVEVAAEAPMLDTVQASLGQQVNRYFMENLPMKGRNVTDVAALAPNISTSPRANKGRTFSAGANDLIGGVDYKAGGGGDNGFYMNGMNVNDNFMNMLSYAPSIESVQEVKLDVINFSAENGHDITSFTMVTRAGTNRPHGAVFDTFSNDGLNAWNPYDKALMRPGQQKPLLQRNQFGVNLGGPIVIPKLYNGRNKLFYFFSYEGKRENIANANSQIRVPTAAERAGDFSEQLRRLPGDVNQILYDPYSTTVLPNGNTQRIPVPNNDIRAVGGGINAQAQQMLAYIPMPNGYQDPTNSKNLANYSYFVKNSPTSARFDTRLDFRATDRDNVYLTVSHSHSIDHPTNLLYPDMPAIAQNALEDSAWVVNLNYARVFRPSLTNEFVFGTGMGSFTFFDPATIDYIHRTDTLRAKFFKNMFGTGRDSGFANLNWGFVPNMNFLYALVEDPNLQITDNLSWTHGRHFFKFGGMMLIKTEDDYDISQRNVTFSNRYTRAGSANSSLGGYAAADFLLGLPTSYQQTFNFGGNYPDRYFRMPYWGFYVDDKFQVTSKLTLSMGLRYDLTIPMYSPIAYGNAFIDFKYPGWQLVIPGRAPGVDLHHAAADKLDFAPRLSAAYRVKSDLVVRASYGIFYNGGNQTNGGQKINPAFTSVPGFVADLFNNARSGINDDIPTLKWTDVFPAQQPVEIGTYPVSTGKGTGWFSFPASLNILDDQSGRVPVYHRYMAQLEKGLGSSSAITVYYLGSHTSHLPNWQNANQPAYRTGWTSQAAFDAARPNNNGRFADVYLWRNDLNSSYNSGTVQFQRRMSKGLQVSSSYTFSKTITDNNPTDVNAGVSASTFWQYNRQLGRGEWVSSHPHRFVTSFVYQIPFGMALPRLAKAVVWGWQASGVVTFESGDALTPHNVLTSARDHEPDVPNVSGNPNLSSGDKNFYQFFNASVFSAPVQDVKGNAGVGIIRGPGQNNWDVSFGKTFKSTERFNAQLRADMFNALNHAQWSGVNTNFTTAAGNTFGRVTGAREPRIMQLTLRLFF